MCERIDEFSELDAALDDLRPGPIPAGDLLRVRRALSEEVRGRTPEVLTMEEVAAFLRIDDEEVGEILDELPAFEIAGRLRIRREKLIEWVECRERSWLHVASARLAGRTEKGVA